jgi:uncharacterized repeat protein (TIGR01451 family)
MWRSWKIDRFFILAGMLCALATLGCSSVPSSHIDPSGEHVFAPPPPPINVDRSNERYYDQPLGQLPWDDVSVSLEPHETVAAIGSEVVLVAGVCGSDGYLRTNRRLEWSIDPGSVGQFVAVGENGLIDWLLGDFNRPRKITNIFAIGSTTRTNTRLNRGTCAPEDNVYVLRGQGWISLTSTVEGTSHVTVFAPEVYRWDSRIKTGVVHWVDAQWRFPPPAISPAGTKHPLTTTVTRASSQSPCEHWIVRYEIVEGPPAGFSPNGAQSIDVPTNSAGQANVEIFQKEPKYGTNKINIQVIRPADVPGSGGQRFIVGSGSTMQTWTGADLAVKTTGPSSATPGAVLNYRIEVSNPGDLPAKDVTAIDIVPDGLTYLNSNPPAESAGRQLQWRLGEIAAKQRQWIEVSFRAEKQGSVANCCEAVAAGGLRVRDCATSSVAAASLDVHINGPTQAAVGDRVTFEITVTNRSSGPADKLTIKDRLDPGFEHPAANAKNAIERLLGNLAPGASQHINVTLHITKPGRLCHTVEVTGGNVATAVAEACINVGGVAGSPSPNASRDRPSFSVKMIGPKQRPKVGEMPQFTIEIANTGSVALKNLKVLDLYDAALLPVLATDGYRIEGGGLAWTIDNLQTGKSTRLEICCTCQKAAAKACNRVSVTAQDGIKSEDEACIEILAANSAPSFNNPPPSTTPETPAASPSANDLALAAVCLFSPVTVGKDVTYEIRVTNSGKSPYQQILVTATVPEEMTINPIGTTGPGPTQFTIEGRTIRFDPVFEIKPGETTAYRVRVRAKQPGVIHFHAELKALTLPQPIVQEVKTEVLPER